MMIFGMILGWSVPIFTAIFSIVLYEKYGLGFTETLGLILKRKLKDRINKCNLKKGDLILLKTKAGYYPVIVEGNFPVDGKIHVQPDSFMNWVEWDYKDVEVIDNETKKILYGGK